MLGALSLETPAAPSACCDVGATCRRAHGAAIEGLRHAHGAGGGGARRLAGLALVVEPFLTDSSFNPLFAPVFRLAYEDAHEAGTTPTTGEHAQSAAPLSAHGVRVASNLSKLGMPVFRRASPTWCDGATDVAGVCRVFDRHAGLGEAFA
ncbi:Uncharacterised protein [Burkholderia pseudomallei]|nr:putative extracellular ligand-binding receptor [Burkholderia pseudomallei]CAJ2881924.1 putative extracellular ligand-binding receptor [Burkholderia pseudomallei]CAJ3361299.1 putative extracellular ligand-binding receptor [Burkholderia pseudomallei]CAJ3507691.1 putative extracellular ligand-binding receptor [Burkholderia pseudomallei]CAJ4616763.1 putative extracellular ligand-binding receptor [Burkholderia pseudomallei]